MVGVRGVGGVPEPAPGRPAEARERKRAESTDAPAQDGVRISPEAKQAAEAARMTEVARQEPDIRADRVAAAREQLERGEYKRADIVAKVAERISRYLEQ
jgi:anti-sigma28 factor (negative regulator of flagellin synthesis)